MGPWLRETRKEVPKAKGICITSLIAVFPRQCSGKFLPPYTLGSLCLAWFRRDSMPLEELGVVAKGLAHRGIFFKNN